MFHHQVITCLVSKLKQTLSRASEGGWELVSVIPISQVVEQWDEENDCFASVKVHSRELYFKIPRVQKDNPIPYNPFQR